MKETGYACDNAVFPKSVTDSLQKNEDLPDGFSNLIKAEPGFDLLSIVVFLCC